MDELNDVVFNTTPYKSFAKTDSKASPFDLIK